MFRKDWRKEFDATHAKINDMVKRLQSEVEEHHQEIEKIEAERTDALAELKFDSIQTADEKIQALKTTIQQKERFIDDLNPKKSVALHRAAEKVLDELKEQKDIQKSKGDKLQAEIKNKITELFDLLKQGDELNKESAEITGASNQFLVVLPEPLKTSYKNHFYSAHMGSPINAFPSTNYGHLYKDLKHFTDFN